MIGSRSDHFALTGARRRNSSKKFSRTVRCSGSSKRARLSKRLERIYRLAVRTGRLRRFVVFGSFITGEPEPNDVDVFLLMEDSFDVDQTSDELRLLFEHSAAQAYFGASIFWLRRLAVISSEQAAIEDWQVKRDGTRRGIVEIV